MCVSAPLAASPRISVHSPGTLLTSVRSPEGSVAPAGAFLNVPGLVLSPKKKKGGRGRKMG